MHSWPQKVVSFLRWHVEHSLESRAVLNPRACFLDALDDEIIIGRSIAFIQHHGEFANLASSKHSATGVARREHLVPCALIVKHALDLIHEGIGDNNIASMIEKHLKIALLLECESQALDSCLKQRVPEGWNWGDNVAARLASSGLHMGKSTMLTSTMLLLVATSSERLRAYSPNSSRKSGGCKSRGSWTDKNKKGEFNLKNMPTLLLIALEA